VAALAGPTPVVGRLGQRLLRHDSGTVPVEHATNCSSSKTPLDIGSCGDLVLAFCDMRTIYLRNVPDEVAARLERMAEASGMSVNALAVRELAAASRRVDNAALLADLPDLPVNVDTLLADRDAGRTGR